MLRPQGLPPPLRWGGVRALSEALGAASEAIATAAWADAADAEGGVRLPSEAPRTASKARDTAAWAAPPLQKGGVRALSEALSAASQARASDARAAVAIAKEATGVHGEKHRAQQAKRALRPHGLPPTLQNAACGRRAKR